MKAQDCKTGDQRYNKKSGYLVYTLISDAAIEKIDGAPSVVAAVQWANGEQGFRVWDVDQDVPLVRGGVLDQ